MIEPTVNVAKAEALASQAKTGKITKDQALAEMTSKCGLSEEKAKQLLAQHGVQ